VNADHIHIDDARLRSNLQAFLRTPAAEPIFEEFDTPWWLCLLGAIILLIAGLCMLPTIIWTLNGLEALWSVLKLEQFKPLGDNPRQHPEKLVPLIAHGIIIGPDQKHALALGTFAPSSTYSANWLAAKAAWLGELYSEDEPSPEDKPVWDLLRDDTFHPYRRRRLPEPHAEGKELYLLDVEVHPGEGQETPQGTVLFAFVAEPGEKGEIAPLPWSATQGAVFVKLDG
jgi:hypothetical protein